MKKPLGEVEQGVLVTVMKFKKETKHTVVYETEDESAPVSSVYVAKLWLPSPVAAGGWPKEIELEVRVLA